MAYVGKTPLSSLDNEDQLTFGICVGEGTAHQLEYEYRDIFGKEIKFSELMSYYNAKVEEGDNFKGEGTNPEYAYQAFVKKGICLEDDYPFSLLTDVHNIPAPSQQAIQNALKFKIKSYTKLDPTTDAIDKAIDSGKVVNVGTVVVSNFVEANEGEYIGVAEGTILGGHDYVIIGRDDEKSHTFSDNTTLTGFYLLQNSWARQQFAWVAKAYIGGEYDIDFHAKILQSAIIVDTGWGNVQPSPIPSPVSPIPVPKPSPDPKSQPTPQPQPKQQHKEQIDMYLDQKDYSVNGFKHTFDVAPHLDKDTNRTVVELRGLCDITGWNLSYDDKDKHIVMYRD